MKQEILLQNVEKVYGQTKVLNDINLKLDAGQHYVLRGPSGSGKSTLFYLIGGLDQPTSGEITVSGKSLTKLSSTELAKYRNRDVGFVFQFHFLLPSMTALQNILLPAQIAELDISPIQERVELLALRLNVKNCLQKYPHQLSGGEQQRINIIRAISLRPALLLCDEPTGNLDSKNSEIVIDLLQELAQENNSTLIIVTHDEKIASRFSHKITIEDGRIIG